MGRRLWACAGPALVGLWWSRFAGQRLPGGGITPLGLVVRGLNLLDCGLFGGVCSGMLVVQL